MSHFTVLVIGKDPEKQLQPYHEYECTGVKDEFVIFVEAEESKESLEKEYNEQKEECEYDSFDQFMTDWHGYEKNDDGKYGRITNPNSKWDWYQLGGRWNGFFKLKETEKGTSDQAIKRDIDFEAMENESVLKAMEKWDKVNEAWKGLCPMKSWENIRKEIKDIEEARKVYNDQERVKAFRKVFDHPFAEIGGYLLSRDQYIADEMSESYQTYAVVKDSIWYEKGEMGWFGISLNEKKEWNGEFKQLIDSVPDDELLSLYDCHI